ncbi:hypothetical protein [Mesobacillus maritimus]|uniref:Uncharacterized protein n=1 Tax=Mesobacillus maritimus TaxID=1643336 RepID=A0ABS7KBU9_9BACI|nr:hypothetical protein [Mesobacillus maritimus]MBY0099685.1 hypothetical protein [Mesobacillus maritimus]
METRLFISIIVLITLVVFFIVYLYDMYKKGKIDENPYSAILLKERTILYFSFFRWKNVKTDHSADGLFPLHKNSTYFWLFIALIHEQIIEMFVLHIYLKKVDPSFANFFSMLHIYSILYIMGDYNWVRNTPILVKENTVEMKIGARRELSFHLRDVSSIQQARLKHDKNGSIIHEQDVFQVTAFPRVLTKLFGISDELKHEIIFNKPITYKGYFGLKKQVSKVHIYIEDSVDFVQMLEMKLTDYEEKQRLVVE